jgi:hypothetical protein
LAMPQTARVTDPFCLAETVERHRLSVEIESCQAGWESFSRAETPGKVS